MSIAFCRVDMRLIHGQILNLWLLKMASRHVLIVDDELADDEFMTLMYQSLAPITIDVRIMKIAEAAEYIKATEDTEDGLVILSRTPKEFLKLVELGVEIRQISLADKMYFSSKMKIDDDIKEAINALIDRGIEAVAQVAPGDQPVILKKYNMPKADASKPAVSGRMSCQGKAADLDKERSSVGGNQDWIEEDFEVWEGPEILILTHGELGRELIRSAEMIMGAIEHISSIPLEMEMNLDEYRQNVFDTIRRLGENTIILIDLLGGTPCNTVALYSRNNPVHALTGASLPMLIDCVNLRGDCSWSELSERLTAGAADSVRVINLK